MAMQERTTRDRRTARCTMCYGRGVLLVIITGEDTQGRSLPYRKGDIEAGKAMSVVRRCGCRR